MDKLSAIDFVQAQQELLPYIPPDQRETVNQARWDQMSLDVAQAVRQWVHGAQHQGTDSDETA